MRILHLITDHQVIERTLDVYERLFPGMNDVLVFYLRSDYKHLAKYKNKPHINRSNAKKFARNYDFTDVTYIVAHYMRLDMIDFIRFSPANIKVCWEIYGHDLYNQFLEPNGYSLYYTSPSKYDDGPIIKRYFPFIYRVYLELKGDKYLFKSQLNRQFEYISHRVSVIQYCCRYDMVLLEQFSGIKYEGYEVCNYPLKTVLGDLIDAPFSKGKDVLIGNSASFSNNHLYILDFIKDKRIPSDLNFIIPLSYGGSSKYVDYVETSYQSVFPNNTITIKNYMPLAEYNQVFTRIRVMVLSAWRQESQGTAIMGFYMGIKVIMSSKSPLLKWFKECGFIVFELETSGDTLFEPLSPSECVHNRELVLSKYKEDNFIENLKSHFE